MIPKINGNKLLNGLNPSTEKQPENSEKFENTLKNFLSDVNEMQAESQDTAESFLRGEVTDLHQVTLAAQKARLSLELMLEIRNKMMESYQEIMRMQV